MSKNKIDPATRAGIVQAIRYIGDDNKVAQYVAGPHEGVTA